MSNKISIIIPIYNVEKYIEDCIKSILAQTYINFEAIFVNDGSPDNSASIIEEYAKKDHRVILKNISNGGVTNARHEGVKLSRSDFIVFVDGDDTLPSYAIERLIDAMLTSKCDMVVGGFNKIFDHKSKLITPDKCVISSRDYIRAMLLSEGMIGSVWARMFKKRSLDDAVFSINRDITLCEDVVMNIKICKYIRSVKVIDDVLYNYKMRSGSETNGSRKPIRYFDRLSEEMRNAITYSFGDDDNLLKAIEIFEYKLLISEMLCNIRNFCFSRNVEIIKKIKNNPNINFIIESRTNKETIIYYASVFFCIFS